MKLLTCELTSKKSGFFGRSLQLVTHHSFVFLGAGGGGRGRDWSNRVVHGSYQKIQPGQLVVVNNGRSSEGNESDSEGTADDLTSSTVVVPWFVGVVHQVEGDGIEDDRISIFECTPSNWDDSGSVPAHELKWSMWFKRPPEWSENGPINQFASLTKKNPLTYKPNGSQTSICYSLHLLHFK